MFWELVGVVVAATLSQIALPALIPTLQLKLYSWTQFDFAEAQYILVASPQDLVGDPAQSPFEFNRVFCGFTLPTAKLCLMHRLVASDKLAPNKWLFDKSPTKSVLLGARSTSAFVAWISEQSGAGGSAVAPNFGEGVFVGYGIACEKPTPADEGKPSPIKMLYGNLPSEIDADKVYPLEQVRAPVANLMNKTKTSVELKEADQIKACSPKSAQQGDAAPPQKP